MTNRNNERQRLAALLDEKAIRMARQSPRAFVEWAWPILEPRTPFMPNFHIDLLCEYLEAVTAAVALLRTGVRLNGVNEAIETAPGWWSVTLHVWEDG